MFELLEQLVVTAAIEAPFTFVQTPVKIVRCQTVEAAQMPLRLVPEVLNLIDVMPSLGHKNLAVGDAPDGETPRHPAHHTP